ncbi:reverse transcriptase [Cucumis melo var. makuwa]|uniref:Reverse transcriptase n=1 Tax=Cucumis melo var. makuwa TaxID=1194695 RepID=A0A5A7V5P7_CUCMM|nr:reverse transcriptase [Cucumis melo var. makuwa]
MPPPELAKLRKPSKMLLNIGFSRPAQAPYGVHALSLKKKDRSPQKCIDRRTQSKLTIPRKYPLPALTRLFDHPCEMKYFPESDIRSKYYRSYRCQRRKVLFCAEPDKRAGSYGGVPPKWVVERRRHSVEWEPRVSDHLQWFEQAMIDGPSLGVVDVTKTPKLEAEQFSCVFEEYLHHCVDGRQKNWVQLRNVTQFSCSAQTDSLIKRSPFEIKGNRHSVLPPLADDAYVGDRPQVHRVEVE